MLDAFRHPRRRGCHQQVDFIERVANGFSREQELTIGVDVVGHGNFRGSIDALQGNRIVQLAFGRIGKELLVITGRFGQQQREIRMRRQFHLARARGQFSQYVEGRGNRALYFRVEPVIVR